VVLYTLCTCLVVFTYRLVLGANFDEVRHSRNFDPSDEFHAWTTSILASFSSHVHSTVPASFAPLRISNSTCGLTGDSD
jgi:hypothetical protein